MLDSLGHFGDARLARGGTFLVHRLTSVGQTGITVRGLGGTRAGELRITRFLRNERVTGQEMVRTVASRTLTRVSGRHILVIQDTTNLRDDGTQHSLKLHPVIAVDAADGALLGLLGASLHERHGGQKARRKERPITEKESGRWLDGTRLAEAAIAAGALTVTSVTDREGDIYEAFALRPPQVELLIRVAQDRALGDDGRLFARIAAMPALGRATVDLPAAPGRAARTATLALRAGPVRLPCPPRRGAAKIPGLPGHVDVWAIEARELDPPAQTEPLHWQLLTTHPVPDLAAAQQLIAFYRRRWIIEELFRTMKTKGFNIEAVQIADTKPFLNLATATLIAAIEVMQLVRDRDGAAKRPLDDVFDAADTPLIEAVSAQLEGKTDRQKNPHPHDRLAFAAWVCARLGGWTGYYGKPGPIVIARGLNQLRTMLVGWRLRKDVRIA
jgi:Transposase DDE domain